MGQRIVEELELGEGVDTIGRWLAHYLAEQMERAAAAPEGEEGEVARRECLDLILRLWERRHRWPLSSPLKDVAAELEVLTNPKPRYFHSPEKTENPWMDLLHRLQELHQKEVQLCLGGWVADLDLSQERDYLHDHPEHLSDEERGLSERLVELQDALSGPDAVLGGKSCPNFSTLPDSERLEWVRRQLEAVSAIREGIVGGEMDEELTWTFEDGSDLGAFEGGTN